MAQGLPFENFSQVPDITDPEDRVKVVEQFGLKADGTTATVLRIAGEQDWEVCTSALRAGQLVIFHSEGQLAEELTIKKGEFY